ncbi:hypothetical protein C8Q79DRAFT_1005402 [Trametes meyenii]|nr:hypothetical protein C8Q79DRAFT_1005392 [Trametes meyenii]KAI0652178.1 hypothetical protein C8Q79DRAFT_1005402 [Trametes meyenii]
MNALEISPLVFAEIQRQLPDDAPLFPILRSLTWIESPSYNLGRASVLSQLQWNVAPRLLHLSLYFAESTSSTDGESSRNPVILERIMEAAAAFPRLEKLDIHMGCRPISLPADILRLFPAIQEAYLDCTMRDWESAAHDEQALLELPQNVTIRTLHLNWDDSDLEALASAVDLGAIECLSVARAPGRCCEPFLAALSVIGRYASTELVRIEVDSGLPSNTAPVPFNGALIAYAGPLRLCHNLSEVMITLPGHSLALTIVELLSLCRGWPDLALLRLDFHPASPDGIFDICQVVREVYKICPKLVSIHLPGLKTLGRPFFHLRGLPTSLPLLHLSSNIFYSEHNPIDIAFALHHAFHKLIAVGPVLCPDGSDWAMVSGLFHHLRVGDSVSATDFIGEKNLIGSGRYPFPLSVCLASFNMGLAVLLENYYYSASEERQPGADLSDMLRP